MTNEMCLCSKLRFSFYFVFWFHCFEINVILFKIHWIIIDLFLCVLKPFQQKSLINLMKESMLFAKCLAASSKAFYVKCAFTNRLFCCIIFIFVSLSAYLAVLNFFESYLLLIGNHNWFLLRHIFMWGGSFSTIALKSSPSLFSPLILYIRHFKLLISLL